MLTGSMCQLRKILKDWCLTDTRFVPGNVILDDIHTGDVHVNNFHNKACLQVLFNKYHHVTCSNFVNGAL